MAALALPIAHKRVGAGRHKLDRRFYLLAARRGLQRPGVLRTAPAYQRKRDRAEHGGRDPEQEPASKHIAHEKALAIECLSWTRFRQPLVRPAAKRLGGLVAVPNPRLLGAPKGQPSHRIVARSHNWSVPGANKPWSKS